MKTKGQKGTAPKQTSSSSKKGNTGNETQDKENEGDKNLKQPIPGKNKGEERNKQRKSLKSDTRNSPDNPDRQESTNIRKKIHSSPGSDTEPMK